MPLLISPQYFAYIKIWLNELGRVIDFLKKSNIIKNRLSLNLTKT